MNPLTEGTEEQGPSRVPFVNDPAKPANDRIRPAVNEAVNDPGNEDPGWGLDDAQVPLMEDDDEDEGQN